MSTANAGNPNDPEPEEQGPIPWVALALALVALVVVAVFGPRLIGILFAVMAPPEPPVPGGVRLLAYNRQVYGVDRWTYDIDQDVCQLVTFYQDQGGQCPVMPPRCLTEGQDASSLQQSNDYVAVCSGETKFSIFAMRWRFTVPVKSIGSSRVQFDLNRGVSWTGDLPPVTETP